jgi:hypothetical protein
MSLKEIHVAQNLKREGETPLNPNDVPSDPGLKAIREDLEVRKNAPSGYIPVQLSTKGKLGGAPALFHIRNLNTEDLMELGLTDQEMLPIKAITMLDNIILEHDPSDSRSVSVKKFHEKEVMELILFVYEAFYTDTLQDLSWSLTEEDYEFLKKTKGGEDSDEYRSLMRSFDQKTWIPKFEVNLATGIHFYEIDPDIKTSVRVSGRDGFTAKFGLPRYGDVIDLKYFIEAKFAEEDRRFASIANTLKMRRDAEDRLMRGENINLRGVPDVPKSEKEKYREYEIEKSVFAMTAIKAYHLMEINHVDPNDPKKVYDVSDLPLEKKIELAKSPFIDHSTFQQVQDMFSKLQFGLKEEITVRDPILDKIVQRKYSFQLIDLLQAIRDKRPSETVLTYE